MLFRSVFLAGERVTGLLEVGVGTDKLALGDIGIEFEAVEGEWLLARWVMREGRVRGVLARFLRAGGQVVGRTVDPVISSRQSALEWSGCCPC